MLEIISQAIEIQNTRISDQNQIFIGLIQRAINRDPTLTAEELIHNLDASQNTVYQFSVIMGAVANRDQLAAELATLENTPELISTLLDEESDAAAQREHDRAINRALLDTLLEKSDRAIALRQILAAVEIFLPVATETEPAAPIVAA